MKKMHSWTSVLALCTVGGVLTIAACSARIEGGAGTEVGLPPLDAAAGTDMVIAPDVVGGGDSTSLPDAGTSDRPANETSQDMTVPDAGARDTITGRDTATTDVPGPEVTTTPDGPAADGPVLPEGPGVFVGVGYGGRRIRSTDDGMTWVDDVQIAANGGDDGNLLRSVVWGNGQFVALGFRVLTSPEGRDWHDWGATIGQWIGAAAFAQGQYVSVGGYGLRMSSTDGVGWTHHDIDTIASHADAGNALVYATSNGGRFVSTNDDGRRSTSTDGRAWVYSTGAAATLTTDLAFGNGIVVGIGGTSVVVSLDGGVTFSDAAQVGSSVRGLVFAQGHFTATANGHVFTSSDGRAWIDRPVTGLAAGMLAYGHGTYINVAAGRLRRSTDGIAWAPAVVLSGTNSIQCVTFGPSG